jgi:fatty-acyl-CoA synthase
MIRSMNIAWWVYRWSELHPDKTAVHFAGHAISYHELHQRASRTACWLQSLGIEKGDRVAAMLRNCPAFIEIYLACSRLGAIFVPVNFRLAGPELDHLLGNCRPRCFVFGSEFAERILPLDLRRTRPLMLLAVVGEMLESGEYHDYTKATETFHGKKPFLTRSLGPASPEEPHVIMYTSGTTGRPKGAVLSHRKTFFNCLNAEIFFKLQFDDVMLTILPLFHSGGLFIQTSPTLYKGATLVLHPRFDPAATFRDIGVHGVTKLLGVPAIYQRLLEVAPSDQGDLSSLRVAAIGGEKTTPELLERCHRAGLSLRQVMGQTETSILLWASEEDSLRKPGTVGRPVFHAEVFLVDRDGRPSKPGEVGEIVVRGSILMKEYWQAPEQTEETMRMGVLHTGDLARVDEDGYFYIVDRAREMFISGGENVYPAEVERVLKRHPAVADAAVVGVVDDTWGEVGRAYIIAEEKREVTETQLQDFCRQRLAVYKVPKSFVFRETFPRTALGKVQKRRLSVGQQHGAGSQ